MPASLSEAALRDTLPPPARLALAYAPAETRSIWLGALALDARLGQVVREAREPLIGQIRLAWWRERLAEPSAAWPAGEPLLTVLRAWEDAHGALADAVDGWELLLDEAPLSQDCLLAAADGRARALAAVAVRLGHADQADTVRRTTRGWAVSDLAGRVSDPREQTALADIASVQDRRALWLPRALRPAVVLHGIAGRTGAAALLTAVRLGILGR